MSWGLNYSPVVRISIFRCLPDLPNHFSGERIAGQFEPFPGFYQRDFAKFAATT
jgi:hypothetical protein